MTIVDRLLQNDLELGRQRLVEMMEKEWELARALRILGKSRKYAAAQ
jgi:hypothetical protein